MTHDSGSYKFMHKLTVMSDFTARYALYNTLTTREQDPMSSEMAVKTARAAFVNYDLATSKELQLINDLGIVPYTKYYIRIQLPFLLAAKTKPARALALLIMSDLAEIQSIFGSAMLLSGIPVNVAGGAFDVVDAVSDIGTFRILDAMGAPSPH